MSVGRHLSRSRAARVVACMLFFVFYGTAQGDPTAPGSQLSFDALNDGEASSGTKLSNATVVPSDTVTFPPSAMNDVVVVPSPPPATETPASSPVPPATSPPSRAPDVPSPSPPPQSPVPELVVAPAPPTPAPTTTKAPSPTPTTEPESPSPIPPRPTEIPSTPRPTTTRPATTAPPATTKPSNGSATDGSRDSSHEITANPSTRLPSPSSSSSVPQAEAIPSTAPAVPTSVPDPTTQPSSSVNDEAHQLVQGDPHGQSKAAQRADGTAATASVRSIVSILGIVFGAAAVLVLALCVVHTRRVRRGRNEFPTPIVQGVRHL